MPSSKSITSSERHRVSISRLPDDALLNIFSYLIFPGEPRHLYHIKHAIALALTSPDDTSIYNSFFTRVTFPPTTRYYSRISDPKFIASIVKLSSDALKHLELPQVNPAPALTAAREFCTNLISLSFYDSLLREKSMISSFLFRCTSLKSLKIQRATAQTLAHFQEPCNFSQLSNLTELVFYEIRFPDLHNLRSMLVLYSKQLQSITLHVQKHEEYKYLINMLCKIRPALVVLAALSIHYNLYKDLLEEDFEYLPEIHSLLDMISSYEPVGSPKSVDIHISSPYVLVRNVAHRLLQSFDPGKITVETTGLTCMASFSAISPPEVSITSLDFRVFAMVFNEIREHLSLQHIEFGASSYVRNSIYDFIQQNSKWIFRNVKSVSIFVPCSKSWLLRLNYDGIQAVLPLLPQLESFAISISAIFDCNMEMRWPTMEMIKEKQPRVVTIYVDDLLPPYLAIYCPSQCHKQYYAASVCGGRLLRLAEFVHLLKEMDSVKEVVMEGDTDWSTVKSFMTRMAKTDVVQRERGLKERKKLAETLLQEVIEMELERNIDMTSVIGWLDSMVHGNSSEIVCPGESRNSGDIDTG